jgi:hypothetical protein
MLRMVKVLLSGDCTCLFVDSERTHYTGQLFWSATSKPVVDATSEGMLIQFPRCGWHVGTVEVASLGESAGLSRSSSGHFASKPTRTTSASALIVTPTTPTSGSESPHDLPSRSSRSDLLDGEKTEKSLSRNSSSGVKRRKEKKEKSATQATTLSDTNPVNVSWSVGYLFALLFLC